MNWTLDADMITDDTIHNFAMARVETAIRYPRAGTLLPQAERLVAAGQVMIVEDTAWVFDSEAGEWRQVFDTHCGHLCADDPCVHQLAAWLARHVAKSEQGHEPPAAGPANAAPGTLGGLGAGYRGGRRSRSGSSRRNTCRDCNKCGFYRHGSCNNPNRRAGRGR